MILFIVDESGGLRGVFIILIRCSYKERLSREGCVAVGAQPCRHTSAQLVMLYAMAETSEAYTHTWGGGVGVSVFYGIYLCLCLALYLYAVIRLGREDKVCHCHVALTVKGLYTASVNKDAYLAQLAVCRS